MNCQPKGNLRTIAYVERAMEDNRVQAPRMSRISLALPADPRLRHDIMPEARTGRARKSQVEPVSAAEKPPRKLISKERSCEILLDWLRKQTEPKSTYDIADAPELIEAMGKKFTSGTIWERMRMLEKRGLAVCEKRKSSRVSGSWAMVAYWSVVK